MSDYKWEHEHHFKWVHPFAHRFRFAIERFEAKGATIVDHPGEIIVAWGCSGDLVRTYSIGVGIDGISAPSTHAMGQMVDPSFDSLRQCHQPARWSKRFVGPISRWRHRKLMRRLA